MQWMWFTSRTKWGRGASRMRTEKSGLNLTVSSRWDSKSSERSEDLAGGTPLRSGLERLLLLPLSPDPASTETSSENVLPALTSYNHIYRLRRKKEKELLVTQRLRRSWKKWIQSTEKHSESVGPFSSLCWGDSFIKPPPSASQCVVLQHSVWSMWDAGWTHGRWFSWGPWSSACQLTGSTGWGEFRDHPMTIRERENLGKATAFIVTLDGPPHPPTQSHSANKGEGSSIMKAHMPCPGPLPWFFDMEFAFAADYTSSLVGLSSLGKALLFKMIALWWPDGSCLQKNCFKLLSICHNNIKICYSGN